MEGRSPGRPRGLRCPTPHSPPHRNQPPRHPSQALLLGVFAVSLFVSALLLFWVQPLFAKMVLPLLGGAPAVWSTAMMFFQAALLAGYAYAHLSARHLALRWQVLLHLALLAAAAAFLPFGVDESWAPPAEGGIIAWLFARMSAALGLPFFALAATAPLLQSWFARSRHRAARDPYFLYAASNLGSLVALAGYPLLLEPALRLVQQSMAWSVGFILLALLIATARRWCAGPGPRRPPTCPASVRARRPRQRRPGASGSCGSPLASCRRA
jgi:hypothetical protein